MRATAVSGRVIEDLNTEGVVKLAMSSKWERSGEQRLKAQDPVCQSIFGQCLFCVTWSA